MDAQQTVHMNPGEGETSYSRNSTFQRGEIPHLIHFKPGSTHQLTGVHSSITGEQIVAPAVEAVYEALS